MVLVCSPGMVWIMHSVPTLFPTIGQFQLSGIKVTRVNLPRPVEIITFQVCFKILAMLYNPKDCSVSGLLALRMLMILILLFPQKHRVHIFFFFKISLTKESLKKFVILGNFAEYFCVGAKQIISHTTQQHWKHASSCEYRLQLTHPEGFPLHVSLIKLEKQRCE